MVSGAAKYVVEQQVGSTWTVIATLGSGSLAYTVTGLTADSTNNFRVAAFNVSGTGPFTNPQNALTLAAPPPNFVAKTASTTQIDLSWNAVAGATGYVVYYEGPGGVWTLLHNLAIGQTSLAVPDLSPGVTYAFEVGAVNASGTTYASALRDHPAGRPEQSRGQGALDVRAQLSWNAVAGATSYVIYWYTSTGWQILTTTAATLIDLFQLSPGKTYTYYVAAVNATGTGQGGTTQTITMPL